VVEINGLIDNNEALRQCEFLFPPSTSRPIIALAALKKNYIQCTFETAGRVCKYICSTIQGMRNHSWEEHRWKSKQKGRPTKDKSQNVPWRTDVHCQRFFKSGLKSGYFEVQVKDASPQHSLGIASRED
jgi:hypothetical protein